jgi:hypothetical protein
MTAFFKPELLAKMSEESRKPSLARDKAIAHGECFSQTLDGYSIKGYRYNGHTYVTEAAMPHGST